MNKKLSRIITLCAMFCISLALAATFAFSSSSTIARADGNAVWGKTIDSCAYGADSGVGSSGFTVSTETAPQGFEKTYERKATNLWNADLSHADISEYEELRFAIKTDGLMIDETFDKNERKDMKSNDWFVFVITKVEGGWNVNISGTEFNCSREVTDTRGICAILYHGVTGMGLRFFAADWSETTEYTVYCTELRGVKPVAFEMVDGASLRIGDEIGGIRFRAKMNETNANAVKNGMTTMKFLVAPKVLFDKVTDGDYANGLSQKIEVPVDATKIYKSGDYYYANGVIANILEANRTLDFCAVACYVSGETTTYAAFDSSLVRGNLYDMVNQLIVLHGDVYAEDILGSVAYGWYGSSEYPITIETVESYNALVAQVNAGRNFSAYYAEISSEVKSATGKTEIIKTEFFPQVKGAWGEMIDSCAYGADSGVGSSGFATSKIAAPKGFEKTYERKSTDVWQTDLSHADISEYKELRFAIKTDGLMIDETFDKHERKDMKSNDWFVFVITKVEGGWNVNISGTDFNCSREVTDTRGICAILFHGVTGMGLRFFAADWSATTEYTVYCTELRGVTDDRYNTNSAKWTDTHKFTAEDTENYMVKDGATEYTVVIPSAHGGEINYAKEELVNFFLKRQA